MNFELRILSQSWIGEPEDRYDLCTHGKIYLKIGDNIISDENDDEWTISTTALALLRSAIPKKELDEIGTKVLHCGMILMASCPVSIDWTVRHDGNVVVISELHKQPTLDLKGEICYLKDNQTIVIERAEYVREILNFSDSVAEFIDKSPPREFGDKFDKKMYSSFLNEFISLRTRARDILKKIRN